MKFLLVAINAKYIHSNPAIYSLRASAGKEAAEKVAALVERAVQRGGAGLSDAQRETFYHVLGVIARNLEGVCATEEAI